MNTGRNGLNPSMCTMLAELISVTTKNDLLLTDEPHESLLIIYRKIYRREKMLNIVIVH